MNNFINFIKNRRSIYALNKNMPITDDVVFGVVRDCVRFVPDAFNMRSQRVLVLVGEKHEKFWNAVYDEMVKFNGGRFSRERTDSFAAAYGTILYFFDAAIVNETRAKYPLYVESFHDWVMQSNGMLQFAIWTALENYGVGANLQHYNPVIDKMVQDMFDLPESWTLVGQMPFGGVAAAPAQKPEEDINIRVKIEK